MTRSIHRLLLAAGAVAATLAIAGSVGAATAVAPGFLAAWKTADSPTDVAANAQGDVWVAYADAPRVARFDVNGQQQVTIGFPAAVPPHRPFGIATDAAGDAFVADTNYATVQEYSRSGALIASFSGVRAGFYESFGIDVDANGNVYIADGGNNRIDKFDSHGTLLQRFGQGLLSHPSDVAVHDGNLYVTEHSPDQPRVTEFSAVGAVVTRWGTAGAGPGQFWLPVSVAIDAGGNVFVSDENGARIEEFSSSGQYLNEWGVGGSGNGEFTGPLGVTVDPIGNIYVADGGNGRVQRFFYGLDPCTQAPTGSRAACGSAATACLRKLVPADEQSCLEQTKQQFEKKSGSGTPPPPASPSPPPAAKKKLPPRCNGQHSTRKHPCRRL